MMRFERGSQVEVLIKKKVASGFWRFAEIVAIHKDGYTVSYYRRSKKIVEKVPVEAVRPCPPPALSPATWSVCDVVEVLDDGFWKTSIIEEDMGDGYYYIHVIGSIDEFRVAKSHIRVRQEWKDDCWALSRKDTGISDDVIYKMLLKTHMKRESAVIIEQEAVRPALLSKTLKRSFPGDSDRDEHFAESGSKKRVVEEDELESINGNSYSFTGKVDDCVSTNERENQGKHNEQTYAKKTTSFIKVDRKNPDVTEFLARTLEPDDCGSPMSSVGSCSILNANSDRLLCHSTSDCSRDCESLCSDADSFQRFTVEEGMVASESEKKYYLKNDEFDLATYRCILEGLYASGPLSWEQEAVLTNIRIRLFISNDEHLWELKRLRSLGDLSRSCLWS